MTAARDLPTIPSYARQRVGPPEILPAGQELAGRFSPPILPIDLLAVVQQAASHLPQPVQPELYRQIDYGLVAFHEPVAKLFVNQLEENCLGGRGVEDLKVRIEPSLHGMRAEQRAAERVDRGNPRRIQIAEGSQPMAGVLFRGA